MSATTAVPEVTCIVRDDGVLESCGNVLQPWPSLIATGGCPDFTYEILNASPGSKFWPAAARIPDRVRQLARSMPARHWNFVEICAENLQRGVDLLENCPALAMLAAARQPGEDNSRYRARIRATACSPWADLLRRLNLPVRPRTIRLLRKLPRAHCSPVTVAAFGNVLRVGHPLMRVLPHLSRITRDTVALLRFEPRYVAPALLQASVSSDWDEQPVAWLLSSLKSIVAERGGDEVPWRSLKFATLGRWESKLRGQNRVVAKPAHLTNPNYRFES